MRGGWRQVFRQVQLLHSSGKAWLLRPDPNWSPWSHGRGMHGWGQGKLGLLLPLGPWKRESESLTWTVNVLCCSVMLHEIKSLYSPFGL